MCITTGQKKAREIWFLAKFYSAQEALDMGLINRVVPLEELEAETISWCALFLSFEWCKTMMVFTAAKYGSQVLAHLTTPAESNGGADTGAGRCSATARPHCG